MKAIIEHVADARVLGDPAVNTVHDPGTGIQRSLRPADR